MKRATKVLWAGGVVAVAMALGACPEARREAPPEIIVPRPPERVPTTSTQPSPVFKMDKPKMLGPVNPAIVLLPARFAEPQVRVRLTGELDGPLGLARWQGKYRGRVDALKLANGKYVVINTIPMDSYLQGVLAKELYGGWSIETYKAQAIAARTYALFQLVTGDAKSRGWDLANDESSQMYGGIGGETKKSRDAVAATRGTVMLAQHKGQEGLFCAFYSACTGIASQDPWEAWGDASVGPLKARRLGDVDAIAPDKYNWAPMVVSKADVLRCVQAWGRRNEVPYLAMVSSIKTMAISKRNATTGRPIEFSMTDGRGKTVPIRAEEFRLALIHDPAGAAPKPFSSHFDVQDTGTSITLVNGHGYGHGIGMSQWGAEALSRRGSTYSQVLGFYYPGASLKQVW